MNDCVFINVLVTTTVDDTTFVEVQATAERLALLELLEGFWLETELELLLLIEVLGMELVDE